MKKAITMMVGLAFSISMLAQEAENTNKQWSFTSVPTNDVSLITADTNWKTDTKSRYSYLQALEQAPLKASDAELSLC